MLKKINSQTPGKKGLEEAESSNPAAYQSSHGNTGMIGEQRVDEKTQSSQKHPNRSIGKKRS